MTTEPLTDGERRAMLLGAQRMSERIAVWLLDNLTGRRHDFECYAASSADGEIAVRSAAECLIGGKGPPATEVLASPVAMPPGTLLENWRDANFSCQRWVVVPSDDEDGPHIRTLAHHNCGRTGGCPTRIRVALADLVGTGSQWTVVNG